MSEFKFYIRFGVHKDRDVIRELNSSIDGICVPAHIFSYSPEPTIYAALTINKSYFIDPMTYIYSDQDIEDYVVEEKENGRQFKPSIKKLTEDYGLGQLFKERDFKRLAPEDLTEEIIQSWADKSIDLQCNKLKNQKESTLKRYEDLLKEIGEESLIKDIEKAELPLFLLPPYFYFKDSQDPWLDINFRFFSLIREKKPNMEVVPLLLTSATTVDDSLIEKLKSNNISKIFLWLDDLDEKDSPDKGGSHAVKLDKFVAFVQKAKEKEIQVTNLYGSYFSMLLSKIGLAGMCNGIFYGENKSRKSKVGGGPQARYYIRALHEFYTLEPATLILSDPRGNDLLDKESVKCMQLINGDPKNIFLFDSDHSLAQRHFIFSRSKELEDVKSKSLEELAKNLHDIYSQYSLVVEKYSRNKSPRHLEHWYDVLSKLVQKDTI